MLKLILSLALVALVSCCTSGCGKADVKAVLGNLDRDCVRHYAGSAAAGVTGNATITFQIDCKPNSEVGKPDPAPPAPAPAAKPPGG